MAADNNFIVVLIDASVPPNLIVRQQKYDPINGSDAVEGIVASALQVVAMFNVRDLDGDMGGPFWDEFSGNSQYRVQGVFDGLGIAKRDLTGATQGVFVRTYFSNATAPADFAKVAKAFEDSIIAQGVNWVVYEDGQGVLYDAELAKARKLVGLPT